MRATYIFHLETLELMNMTLTRHKHKPRGYSVWTFLHSPTKFLPETNIIPNQNTARARSVDLLPLCLPSALNRK
jgi:hypothetical protein